MKDKWLFFLQPGRPTFSILVLLLGLAWIAWSRMDPALPTQQIQAPRQGFLAPDFTLTTATGEEIQLASLKGKPVLLNIWASWCLPCQVEMPAMQRVYEAYQEQGFTILAVNATYQDNPNQALNFASDLGLTFPILFDESGEVSKIYHSISLPTSFFIDAQGIIQDVVIGGPMAEALLRARVEQLLK